MASDRKFNLLPKAGQGVLHLFKQLADGLVPRDSSQAEKKVTVTKAEQIHRMAIIFTKKTIFN